MQRENSKMNLQLAILLTLHCLVTCGNHDNHDHGHDDHNHGHVDGDHNDDDSEEIFGSGDYHGTEVMKSDEAHIYIEQLFHKYGKKGVMTFEGFEHLLQSLGIGKVTIEDHDIHDHYTETGFVEFHVDHNHTASNSTTEVDDGDLHEHVTGSYDDDEAEERHDTENDHVNSGNHDHDDDHHDHHQDHHGERDHDSAVVDSGNHDDDNYHGGHDDEHDSDGAISTHLKDENSRQRQNRRNRRNKKNRKSDDVNNEAEEHDTRGHAMKSAGEEVKGRVKRASPEARYSNPRVMPEIKKCLTAQEILSTYHITYDVGITEDNFLHLCPAIVYQIDAHTCSLEEYQAAMCQDFHDSKGSHCQQYHGNHRNHGKNLSMEATVTWDIRDIPPKVWLYASGAITGLSLVGLFCVAIIPIMQRVFYNHLIQFLVALAIGSLTGDALLHLIPHALASIEETGSHDDHDEGEGHGHDIGGVYKGATVLAGIYFFFIMERFMDYFTQWKKNRKETKKRRQLVMTPLDHIGEKLSKYDSNSRSSDSLYLQEQSKIDAHSLVDDSVHESTLDTYDELELYEVDDGKQEHHHGHSHGDGKVPKTVAAMAWMVIMGDGLHNLSDGLAIGAAFANSVTGGLSTTIAVFCHELPHELGDFAVLLRAGMSVKQALFYNIVSSVLSFLGMIIGVALGNIESASLWIFALAAGMFIYISLVDMMPEITGPVPAGQSRCCIFILHILGISAGVTVMMMIALYEDKIVLSIGS